MGTKKPPPVLSEPRQRLARAIAELAALRDERERLRRTGDGWGASHAAQDAVGRAEVALAAAVENDVHHRTLVLAGEAPDDRGTESVADARRTLQRAQDELAASREAGTRIRSRAEAIDREMPLTEMAVRQCARVIVLVECADARRALAERLMTAQREYLDIAGALGFVASEVPHPPSDELRRLQILADSASAPCFWPGANTPGASPSAARWREAYAALQKDAAALLPEV
jgi:hypothetical protein